MSMTSDPRPVRRSSGFGQSPANDSLFDNQEDNALLVRLKEAINQDNPAAVMCIKAAVRDSSEEQWERMYNQLESRHQAYIQLKNQQHSDELRDLQELVRRNLATERRILDEQLANHKSALASNMGTDDEQQLSISQGGTRAAGSTRKTSLRSVDELSPTSLEHRKHLCDHLSEPPDSRPCLPAGAGDAIPTAAEVARLRAALALAEDRLARSRRQCGALLGRLTAAEAELQFLRNRRVSRRSASLSEATTSTAGDDSVACLRQSLAELERRQLIDTAAGDALELPAGADPVSLEHRYDCLQTERREIEAALTRVPGPGSLHHTWHSARDRELLEKRLDTIDRELVHLRNSLKQFQLI